MPINGFSVGRDVSLIIQTPNGPLVANLVTHFSSKPDMTEVKVKGLDGITRHVRFFDGWSGKFEYERQDSTLDDYFAQLESNYYLGIPEMPCTISETIENPNLAITQYLYVAVLLKLDDGGAWEGDKTVKMGLSFVASRRLKTA
jgi:hypothetical protein